MKKRPELYLRHMLDACDRIAEYIGNMKREEFLRDAKTVDAVIRQFEILGEAAGRVPANCVGDSPIPWKTIVGLRNKLIHDYMGVDVEIVWQTVKGELPRLRAYVKKKV